MGGVEACTVTRTFDGGPDHMAVMAPPAPLQTHRAVAAEAGVSVVATTYHFETKVYLVEAAYRRHLETVRERAEGLAGGPLPFAESRDPARLSAGLARYLEQGVRVDREGSLATFELSLERARDPALRRRLKRWKQVSDDYATEAISALGSERPEDDATLLICALNGLRLEWLAEGERSRFAERIPALAERLAGLLRRA